MYVCSSQNIKRILCLHVCVQSLPHLLIHLTSTVITFKACYDIHRPGDENIAEKALALLKLLEFMSIKYSELRFGEFSLQIMLTLFNNSLLEYIVKIS